MNTVFPAWILVLGCVLCVVLCLNEKTLAQRMFVADPATKTFDWVYTVPPSLTFTGENVFKRSVIVENDGSAIPSIFLRSANVQHVWSLVSNVSDANNFGFSIRNGANTHLFVAANGNVGLGSTSPVAKLSVSSKVPSTLIHIGENSLSSGDALLPNSVNQSASMVISTGDNLDLTDSRQIIWSNANQRRAVLLSPFGIRSYGAGYDFYLDVGRVGIGLMTPGTTPNNHGQTTSANLHVLNRGSMNGNAEVLRLERYNDGEDIVQGSAGSIGMYMNDNNEGGGEIARISWEHDGVGPVSAEGNGMLKFWTSNVGNADGVPEERMTIQSNGHVGIGTTAPKTELDVHGVISEYNSPVAPTGMIIAFHPSLPFSSGWVLCDGSTHQRLDGSGQITAPDLRNRFILAASSQNAAGTTGGQSQVTLTTSQMPAHDHGVHASGWHNHAFGGGGGDGGSARGVNQGWPCNPCAFGLETDHAGLHTHTLTHTGGNQAHDNMPPYYSLVYLMRL